MTLTFDGNMKHIQLSFDPGSDELSVDAKWIYSRWKEWVFQGDNSKWLNAFTNIGGEPVGGGEFVGATFFLVNGWHITPCPTVNNSKLIITNNLFPEFAGDDLFTYECVPDGWRVAVERRTSTLPVALQTGVLTDLNIEQISQSVWSHIIDAGLSAEVLYRLIAAVQLGKSVVIGDQVQFLQVSAGTVARVVSDIDPTDQERLTVTLDPSNP